jgi:hypothetical protein
MAGWLELNTIAPGTPVFDADNRPVGAVEAIEGQTIRVGGRLFPAGAVARVDPAGIFLHPEGAWEGADTGGGGAAPIAGDDMRRDTPLSIVGEGTAASPRGDESPLTPAPARTIHREEGQIVIPLAEERPVVGYREIDLGEFIVVKRVIEEERTVPVIIRREVVERVHRAPDGTETIEELSTRTLATPDRDQIGRNIDDSDHQ